MKRWLISDTHFNHANIKEYCGRPDDFNERLFQGLFNIPEEDILIHLGDVCFGGREVHNKYILPIRCKKWLVRGNHDKESDSFYLSNGWDFVCEQFQNLYFGKRIVFSHRPVKNGDFNYNIHGHFHNNLPRLQRKEWVVEGEEARNKDDLVYLTDKHKLIACELTNYKPVLLETFIKKL